MCVQGLFVGHWDSPAVTYLNRFHYETPCSDINNQTTQSFAVYLETIFFTHTARGQRFGQRGVIRTANDDILWTHGMVKYCYTHACARRVHNTNSSYLFSQCVCRVSAGCHSWNEYLTEQKSECTGWAVSFLCVSAPAPCLAATQTSGKSTRS